MMEQQQDPTEAAADTRPLWRGYVHTDSLEEWTTITEQDSSWRPLRLHADNADDAAIAFRAEANIDVKLGVRVERCYTEAEAVAQLQKDPLGHYPEATPEAVDNAVRFTVAAGLRAMAAAVEQGAGDRFGRFDYFGVSNFTDLETARELMKRVGGRWDKVPDNHYFKFERSFLPDVRQGSPNDVVRVMHTIYVPRDSVCEATEVEKVVQVEKPADPEAADALAAEEEELRERLARVAAQRKELPTVTVDEVQKVTEWDCSPSVLAKKAADKAENPDTEILF